VQQPLTANISYKGLGVRSKKYFSYKERKGHPKILGKLGKT